MYAHVHVAIQTSLIIACSAGTIRLTAGSSQRDWPGISTETFISGRICCVLSCQAVRRNYLSTINTAPLFHRQQTLFSKLSTDRRVVSAASRLAATNCDRISSPIYEKARRYIQEKHSDVPLRVDVYTVVSSGGVQELLLFQQSLNLLWVV